MYNAQKCNKAFSKTMFLPKKVVNVGPQGIRDDVREDITFSPRAQLKIR